MTTASRDISLPTRLRKEAEKIAAEDGTTLEQFVSVAVAEKIAALRAVDYLRQRADRGNAAEALAILEQAGANGPVQSGDEV